MFMEAFATGFSLSSGTKPGYSIENDEYKLTFQEVICDQTKNIVSRGFENCYNWKAVMELILGATEDIEANIGDIETFSTDAICDWLVTFGGWGLLSSILDSKMHRHVLLSLAYTSSHWDQETGGEFSEEKVFNVVKYVYDNMPGKELYTLVPVFKIDIEEIVDGSRISERKKELSLFFHAKWDLEIKFVIEKKRNNKNLVDLAAEMLVQNILSEDEIVELPIPETLFNVVRIKLCDIEWIRSYWNAQPKHASSSVILKNRLVSSHQNSETSKVAEVQNVERQEAASDEEEEETMEEEFLSYVVDEITDDVQQIIDQHIDAGENNTNQRSKNGPPNGIDSLLIVWVVVFLVLAVIVYSCC